jgi:hypothetical protein
MISTESVVDQGTNDALNNNISCCIIYWFSRHDREAEYIINLDLSDEVTQSRERGMTAGTFEP